MNARIITLLLACIYTKTTSNQSLNRKRTQSKAIKGVFTKKIKWNNTQGGRSAKELTTAFKDIDERKSRLTDFETLNYSLCHTLHFGAEPEGNNLQ